MKHLPFVLLLIWIALPAAAQSDLDLPVLPPDPASVNSLTGTIPPPPISEDDTDDPEDSGDDPRDTPPPVIYGEELESENDTIFYVIDISCSMGWGDSSYMTPDGRPRRGSRLDRAKAEVIKSIMGLSNNMLFNIIAYDCGIRLWEDGMRPADNNYKASAISWLYALQAVGATGTGPAAAAALALKDNMMVALVTDGCPNCGASGYEGHRRMISNSNTQGATINVFGIGANGEMRAFCQAIASDSGGLYFDVP
jgi:hypothetical protein